MSGGQVPWIALALAVSFTGYGVIRKQCAVGGMPGLFVETLILLPFAAAGLGWLMGSQAAIFGADDLRMSVLLLLAGPLTVIPLLFFALAARRLVLASGGRR